MGYSLLVQFAEHCCNLLDFVPVLESECESGRFAQAFNLVCTFVYIIVILLQRITRCGRKDEFHYKRVSEFLSRVVQRSTSHQ